MALHSSKVVLHLLSPLHDTNATIFTDYFSEAYMYSWLVPEDMKEMRMNDTKCKRKSGFRVNVSLAPKSVVRVVTHHSMCSNLELTLLIRTRIHIWYLKAQRHSTALRKPAGRQVCSFEGQFCQSFNT